MTDGAAHASDALPVTRKEKGGEKATRWLPKGRIARLALFLVAAVLAVELLYLTGANLSLRWASGHVARRSGITVDYSKAYTLIPGHVHFTDLRLGGIADGGWRAHAATADVVVGLIDLITLTNHFERVRMTGVAVDLDVPDVAAVSLLSPSTLQARPLAAPDATGLVLASLLGPSPGASDVQDSAVEASSSQLLRVDEVAAKVTQLTYGTRKLTGDIDVDASGVTLRRVGTTLGHAELHVVDAALDCGDDALARGLSGHVDVRIDADATRSIIGRTTAHVELDGRLASVAPLLSLTGLTSKSAHGGKLHAAGSIDHGVVAGDSVLRAETTAVDLDDAAGDVVTLPKGLVVSVEASTPNRLRFTLKTPKIVLGSRDSGKKGDAFSDVSVGVDGGETDLTSPRPAVRALDWEAKRAVVHEGTLTLTATLRGSLQIAAGPLDAAGVVAKNGDMEASDVVLERPASTEHAAFGVRLLLSNAQISKEGGLVFAAQVKASGRDAGVLFSLLGSTPAIRLALGSIDKKPFTMDGTLTRRPGRLGLEAIRLESHGVSVNGAYYRRDDTQRAAFVVTYGHLPLGVSIVDGADQVVFAPPSNWLADRTREAASLLAP